MAARKQLKLLDTLSRAPDFHLRRLDGGETALADILSKGPVVLAFFKVTCPVCQLTFPYLERIYSSGKLPVFGVSQNCPEDTREFNRRFGVSFPTLLDNEDNGFSASNAYGISSVPTAFLIESDGTVSRVIEGWSKSDIEWLGRHAGVRALRPGEDVPQWKAG